MNLADDQNAVIIMVASFTSQGSLLLIYINIETLPHAAKDAFIISEVLVFYRAEDGRD